MDDIILVRIKGENKTLREVLYGKERDGDSTECERHGSTDD